jgi:hypothetical protein
MIDGLVLENVSLCKIDVEGGEADFLCDVAPFLAERRIPLWLEMHEPLAPFLDQMPGWFAGFDIAEGEFATYGHLLAVPK